MPITENENVQDIVKKIGSAINEVISDADIDICHRVPVPKKPTEKHIVVQFCRRDKRDTVLSKARQQRLSTKDLGHESADPIFVNEHLCPAKKKLLGAAIAQKKKNNWKFAWTKNGNIFIRKDETTRAVLVSKIEDLEKIEC